MLLVQPLKESEIRKSGIIITTNESDKKESYAKVIEIGPDVSQIKKDDIIYAPPYYMDRVDDKYELIHEEKVLMVVEL